MPTEAEILWDYITSSLKRLYVRELTSEIWKLDSLLDADYDLRGDAELKKKTKPEIIKVILKDLQEKHPDDFDVYSFAAELDLLAIALHPEQKIWEVMRLTFTPEVRTIQFHKMKCSFTRRLVKFFESSKYEADINLYIHAEAIWGRVVLTDLSRNLQTNSPMANYFVYYQSTPFIACTLDRCCHREMTLALTRASRGLDFDMVNGLSGKNPLSLLKSAFLEDKIDIVGKRPLAASTPKPNSKHFNPASSNESTCRAPDLSSQGNQKLSTPSSELKRKDPMRYYQNKKFKQLKEFTIVAPFSGLPSTNDEELTEISLLGTNVLEGIKECHDHNFIRSPMPEHMEYLPKCKQPSLSLENWRSNI